MTSKEKLLVKRLGYVTFSIYSYVKHHPEFHNKDMQWELGVSARSTQRAFEDLKKCNIFILHGHCHNRFFEIQQEKDWLID